MISVVIAVRDGLPWLEDQLKALSEQDCPGEWEVVVADNGSTDASPETAASWASRSDAIRLVDASSRAGPSSARNVGVSFARGDLLAFCDADDVVQPGWLAAIGSALGDADVVAGCFDHGSLNGAGPSDARPAATHQLGQVPAGLAANLGMRRSVFEALGGFDEDLRVGEDIDLCWRSQFAGYKFATVPGAVVAKRERETALGVFENGLAHGRSGPRLYRKHRASGIRRDFRGTLKAWAWLLVEVPRLHRRDVRRRWLRVTGVRLGRLLGSAENRVFFP